MRTKKALLSTIVALVLQLVSILSALIVPRMIISVYGSSVNGLIQSITQFLGYISLLQLGVGGVVRAALYKPLADSNNIQISQVVKSADVFFKKIGFISIVYIIFLAIGYPLLAKSAFDFWYTAILVVVIGLSTIAQYMFGFPYRLLTTADQRAYVFDFTQVLATIANIIISVILIKTGASVHIVKLGSAIVFVGQPIALSIYVSKKYNINKKVKPDDKAIEQRWAGMGYSLADFVHRKTDYFVLTIFSSLIEVSVYSVYSVITSGLNSVITMATNSFQAVLGNMLAKKEDKVLNDAIRMYIFIVHLICTIIFSVALALILPFVSIYTEGITDASYIRPLFSVLILIADCLYCMRQPYQSLIIAAGHFRETQRGAILEAIINITISMVLVKWIGVTGVAIGTLVAMLYRSIDLVNYLKNHIINYPMKEFLLRYFVSGFSIVIITIIIKFIPFSIHSYTQWICYAIIATIISASFAIITNILIYKQDFNNVLLRVKRIVNK